MSSLEESPSATAAVSSDEPKVSLVEIEPGVAVLFADQSPVDLDLVPFEMLSAQASRNAVKLGMAACFPFLRVRGFGRTTC